MKIMEDLTFPGCFGNYICDLRLGGVLSQSPQEITENFARDGACSLLIEQGKSFFVLCTVP